MEGPSTQIHYGIRKPIGAYLVEAGLLTDAQVGVALADQRTTSLPFGEVVVTRGWVKEQTIEYLMQKVILPERSLEKQNYNDLEAGMVRQNVPRFPNQGTYSRRNPKANNTALKGPKTTSPPRQIDDDEGVSWIG